MNYASIKYCDIANGKGVRTVLFVSGCRNHCKGCFQPDTWNFNFGELFTEEIEEEILKSLEPSYIQGLTLLGGDPFEEENQKVLLPFVRKVKKLYPNKDIWAYTGYILEKDFIIGGRKNTNETLELLSLIDVLVDGPFILDLKDITLKFKGSSNQRVINLNKSIENSHLYVNENDLRDDLIYDKDSFYDLINSLKDKKEGF